MLPPANRLRKEKEIKRALASPKSRRFGLLVCKTAANDSAVARFCFVVSKRVSKNATARNKLKRRLRAAAAAILKNVLPGFDCVIIANPGANKKEYRELAAGVEKLLAMSGVLSNLKLKDQNEK
ncbi:MAG: ribonuclease P protein component [Candidatus Nealsonbacteria bacterium DGGOD1a]|jgi:ribonuclease P protein component, eubacterial|nr:MAG: ribonuclease P protein component [Candidatus Nealsonbacteria bacterium DGGOD1a]